MNRVIFLGREDLHLSKMMKEVNRGKWQCFQSVELDIATHHLKEEQDKIIFINADFYSQYEITEFIRETIEVGNDVYFVIYSKVKSLNLKKALMTFQVIAYVDGTDLSDDTYRLMENFEKQITYIKKIHNLNIAVLDDDRLQLTILSRYFSNNGFTNIHYFNHPNEFYDSFERYDMYLIDIVLPGLSGDEIIFEIRKKNPDALILAISSLCNDATIANVLFSGADDYIVKPVSEAVFMAKVYSNCRNLLLLQENRMQTELLREEAIRDGLTGLYNHKYMFDTLKRFEELALRYQKYFSVIMLDIDYFKKINDTYGHAVGDEVLKELAGMLRKSVRKADVVGRYGGEEFILLLYHTALDDAYHLAEKLRKKAQEMVFSNGIKITISLGVSEYTSGSEPVVERADRLLYVAKNNGRNKTAHSMG